ncbi:MAG TPA: recombinase family protein [Tepidisphaeraceae bacterium]|jgi:DNA invertase Pin-like site-specific DNA recombinase|nr:recombinase family protein [Tepidisphaeraceae bacterium]
MTATPFAPALPPPPHRSNGPTAGIVAVGYLRRSTDRQEQSLPDQRQAVEHYAAAHGMQMSRFYVDDAISGTSTAARKAFQQMIADAQLPHRPFTVVVVYDVKRFGRVDNDEAGYWRHLLRAAGVQVRYVTENFTGDGTDDLLRPVKQWQARQESKDLSKVTIRGLLTRSTTGCWMGGAPPYGYDLRYATQAGQFLVRVRYEPDGTKLAMDEPGQTIFRTITKGESLAVTRRDRCWLVPGRPDRAEAVRRIFDLYAGGRGFKLIASALNREGVPPARGPGWARRCSGLWSLTSVRAILVNPAYCGDLAWNRRTDARFHRIANGVAAERHVTGRRLEANAPQDWVVVPDAHPPLVPRALWESANRRMAAVPESHRQRGTHPQQRSGVTGPKAKFLLSGLITCGRCGGRYEGITQRLRTKDLHGNTNKSYFYACGNAIRRGPGVCTFGQVSRDGLERAVVAAVVRFYDERYGGSLAKIRRAIEAMLGEDRTRAAATQGELSLRLAKVEGTVRNLLDNITAANRAMVDRRLVELAAG